MHIVQCTLGIMNIVGGLGSLIPGNAEDDTIDWASVAFGLACTRLLSASLSFAPAPAVSFPRSIVHAPSPLLSRSLALARTPLASWF